MKEKKIAKRYNEEFKRQAVELLIHSGKRQAQVARELGVSDYTMTLWKKLLWIAVTLLGLFAIYTLAISRGEPVNALWIVVAGLLWNASI